MAREKEDYREILGGILEYSNGKRVLSNAEVAAYLGLARATTKKRYGIDGTGIAVEKLARLLA